MLVSSTDAFRKNHIKNIVVGRGAEHPYAIEMRDAGLDVYKISSYRFWTLGGRRLRQLIAKTEPDIVHIHTEGDWLLTVYSLCLFRKRRPVLVRTVHSVFTPRGLGYLKRRLQAFLADCYVSQFIAPSPEIQQNEANYGRHPILVHNWVDDRFIRSVRGKTAPSKPPVATIVGNCSDIKNHELALEAALDTDWDIVHLGSTEGASQRERELLEKLDLGGKLRFCGSGNPLDFFPETDLFMMPSHKEGFGVALAEALSFGVPAVVSDVPSFQWTDDIQGVTRLEKNVSTWNYFLNTFEQGAEVNLGGWDFSPNSGADKYTELYHKILSSRASVEQ